MQLCSLLNLPSHDAPGGILRRAAAAVRPHCIFFGLLFSHGSDGFHAMLPLGSMRSGMSTRSTRKLCGSRRFTQLGRCLLQSFPRLNSSVIRDMPPNTMMLRRATRYYDEFLWTGGESVCWSTEVHRQRKGCHPGWTFSEPVTTERPWAGSQARTP